MWPEIAAISETHAYARETGIMYGDNRADEREARRSRLERIWGGNGPGGPSIARAEWPPAGPGDQIL